MVTRNKAVSEIFAEIGGTWATSALILTVFFKPIILHVVDGQPSKDKRSTQSEHKLCVRALVWEPTDPLLFVVRLCVSPVARWRTELPTAGKP